MWCGHSFNPKAVIVVFAFLIAGFNERKSRPSCFNFRFVTPWRTVSVALRERDIILQQADLFRLRTSCRRIFRRQSSLRRHASTNARLPVSFLKCCKILRPITHSSNLYLHYHWSNANAEVIMMRCWHGGDLINLFSPKDVYRRSSFFFLGRARPRTLADVFEKDEKKNKKINVCVQAKSIKIGLERDQGDKSQ